MDGSDTDVVYRYKVIKCLCYDQLQASGHHCILQLKRINQIVNVVPFTAWTHFKLL